MSIWGRLRCLCLGACVWLCTDADSTSHGLYVSFHWFLTGWALKMTTEWSTINTWGTMNYRTFKIQKWQTSFNFNLQHLIFMAESWLALLTAVPLVSFDIGLAIIFRKAVIGFLAPNRDITENLFVVRDESLEKLACLWSFSILSFLQWDFLQVRGAYPQTLLTLLYVICLTDFCGTTSHAGW